jgi:hypothetical protein
MRAFFIRERRERGSAKDRAERLLQLLRVRGRQRSPMGVRMQAAMLLSEAFDVLRAGDEVLSVVAAELSGASVRCQPYCRGLLVGVNPDGLRHLTCAIFWWSQLFLPIQLAM